MNKRNRFFQWCRETRKARRRLAATAWWRRSLPKNDIRRWAIGPSRLGEMLFHSVKPNPFYGWRYPYRREDGPLRWMYRDTTNGSPITKSQPTADQVSDKSVDVSPRIATPREV